MHQGRVVQHLDRGGHRHDLVGGAAVEKAVRGQRDGRTQPLAAAAQQSQKGFCQRFICPYADRAHFAFDALEIILNESENR